jgi:hypothetical protein
VKLDGWVGRFPCLPFSDRRQGRRPATRYWYLLITISGMGAANNPQITATTISPTVLYSRPSTERPTGAHNPPIPQSPDPPIPKVILESR